MNIEVKGFNPEDRRFANTILAAGGQLCAGQGIVEGDAYITGVIGAEYGAAVAFTALRQMGLWPPEGFDATEFEIKAREIVDASLVGVSAPNQDQEGATDQITKIFEVRRIAQERANVYGDALGELVEAAAKLRGTHLVISGKPYALADSLIYSDREQYRVTEQKVRVRDAHVTDDRRDDAERPVLHINVTLPCVRGNGHEPLAFNLHDLDMCVIDESPAEEYYTGEIYLD